MSAGRPEHFQSELIATVPANGGSVLLFTFAYPVGALTSYMSLVTVTDPDQQSSGKSGKFRFDDWYLAASLWNLNASSSICPPGLSPSCFKKLS